MRRGQNVIGNGLNFFELCDDDIRELKMYLAKTPIHQLYFEQIYQANLEQLLRRFEDQKNLKFYF